MAGDAKRRFSFICGQDDFLVDRMGRRRFEELAQGLTDEFSREVLSGFASKVEEVEAAVGRFTEAVQTMPMFGGRRVIWLKDVNFLADSQTGGAETTLKRVEDLRRVLESVDPAETSVLITASPVDRRRSFVKWCETAADFALAGGGDAEELAPLAIAEARAAGATFGPGALQLLQARVGPNARLLVEEIHKLATSAEDGAITEAGVAELTPNVAEGEFFETAEAFFSGKLDWALEAIRRHFFAGGEARAILGALQSRNRILIQVRALADAGEVRAGPRGVDGLQNAAAARAPAYGAAASAKSGFNIFTQNPWYLGKIAGAGALPSLKRLIDNQRAFISAFEEVLRRPADDQEDILRDLAVRCLAP